MATRSNIGIIGKTDEDGIRSVRYIYCHFDGYPDGVGSTLKNHYTDIDKIEELIEGGDISSLEETLEDTVFYRRDRGETGTDYELSYIKARAELDVKQFKHNEYLYLYDTEEAEWLTF